MESNIPVYIRLFLLRLLLLVCYNGYGMKRGSAVQMKCVWNKYLKVRRCTQLLLLTSVRGILLSTADLWERSSMTHSGSTVSHAYLRCSSMLPRPPLIFLTTLSFPEAFCANERPTAARNSLGFQQKRPDYDHGPRITKHFVTAFICIHISRTVNL